ncbi:Polyketide cyclase / dehydrase and lipid transport [Sinosporangium album]|uniref:Polyketide cyclase / dehydrase and lipid transport n=1 Tax=Sinosporangium album TaxID=504805 RepID=A0A1G8JHA2_9ACTN|nr:Polyketide cyclase / dehydrase and lipid transport [Sinosporangium album]
MSVRAGASAERVFAVLTDWPRHREWMVLTSAEVREGDGRSVGSRIAAFSGVGPAGFLDTMTITRWEPPHLVEVAHTGRLVRGSGAFRIEDTGPGRSVITWWESLDLPFGPVGRVGWLPVRPLSEALLRLSLQRLARLAARPG